EMIVGEAQVKRVTGVDGKETEGHDGTVLRKGPVELALDLFLHHAPRVAGAGKNRYADGLGPAAILEACAPPGEEEPRQAGRLELTGDARSKTRRLQRLPHHDDMHGVVWMQLPPTQHRGLKQIELASHRAGYCSGTVCLR